MAMLALRSLRRIAFAVTGGVVGLAAAEVAYVRLSFRLPPCPSGPVSGIESPAAAPARPGKRHIVFLGDSTAMGTGCSEVAGALGPVMPRSCASLLAHRLGENVSWTALGTVGADVPALMCQHLKEFRVEAERLRATGECIDAVVLLCGLNDVKACFLPGDLEFESRAAHPFDRNPTIFGKDLEALLLLVLAAAGKQCTVLVPEEPMADSPRFAALWPLSAAMRTVASIWDDQKKQACVRAAAATSNDHGPSLMGSGCDSNCTGVLHVPMPPVLTPSLYCVDGMHPNDRGYRMWGEMLACVLMGDHLRSGQACIPSLEEEVQLVTSSSAR